MTAFIGARKGDFGVEPICRVLGVSASAYYERVSGRESARAVEDRRLRAVLCGVHRANYGAYGSRRMWKQLAREGEVVGRDRVRRLMAVEGLAGAKRRRAWRTTVADPAAVPANDLVKRNFTATAPDQLYVADFTYLWTWTGRAYFAFVIDVFTRRVVGWQLATNMRAGLVVDALQMAVSVRKPTGVVIHHSDHGSQYTSGDMQDAMAGARITQSMGSKGDAYDNAMAESFVDTFKTELISGRSWPTLRRLEFGIIEYLAWYDADRLHSSLDDRPPAEFEQEWRAGQATFVKPADEAGRDSARAGEEVHGAALDGPGPDDRRGGCRTAAPSDDPTRRSCPPTGVASTHVHERSVESN